MKPILCCLGTTFALIFSAAVAPAQSIPVPQNLWRLVAQEDTDGDQKITIHDHTTPFEIRDQNGAEVRRRHQRISNVRAVAGPQAADDQHMETIAMDKLHLNEDIVDRTHQFIKTNSGTR